MKFKTTRSNAEEVLSAQAIVAGISSCGGLYVPAEFPVLSLSEIESLKELSFSELSAEILSKYLTDFSKEELSGFAGKAYAAEKWGGENTIPVVKLSDELFISELWHGPTCAFKDVALQMLPHLLTQSMKKTGVDKTVVILVATSGDTGKAALDGFCDIEGTKIIVFYPENGVSDIQKLQMRTQDGENVYVAAIKGNFDNAQNGVKEIFGDAEFAESLSEKGYLLSSANSINFGRLVPQIVYYFSSYLELCKKGEINFGEKINFAVPTGNFGNILAGFYAKQMGLPIGKLICASNENNVLTDFIETGIYNRNRDFYLTTSPSMDILISSNLERLLYHLSGSAEETASYMKQLADTGKYQVSSEILAKIKENFIAGFCDSEEGEKTIGEIYKNHKYVADTHTAVALNVALDTAEKAVITVVLSTANPHKFSKAVLAGLGCKENLSEFRQLQKLAEYGVPIPPSLASLETKTARFSDLFDDDKMKSAVTGFLK